MQLDWWRISHADRDHHYVLRCGCRGAVSVGYLGADAGGRHTAGHRHNAAYFQTVVQNDTERPTLFVYAGAAALPQAAGGQDHRPVHIRQNAVRAGAGGDGCRAGRPAHLGNGQHPCGGFEPSGALRKLLRPVCSAHRPGRVYSDGVYTGLSRQRDRGAHRHHELYGDGQPAGAGFTGSAAPAAGVQRVDMADGAMHDAVFADALAVRHHVLDDKKGNAELEVDGGFLSGADSCGHSGVLCRRKRRPSVGAGLAHAAENGKAEQRQSKYVTGLIKM